MMRNRVAGLVFLFSATGAIAGELGIVSVDPVANSQVAGLDATLSVTFDRPVDRASVSSSSFWACGRSSGTVSGRFGFTDEDRTITLTPDTRFVAGEVVTVLLSHDLVGADGTPFRSAGHSHQFWTRTRTGSFEFEEIAVLSTRTSPAISTRAYGGTATDYDEDGYLDLAIVNEDTGDVRLFLNEGDGSGQFGDFLTPTTPINFQASPSETADFNHDGLADLTTANGSSASVSILLGQGDGTFAPQQEIPVGPNARGIAVLDFDGDGDLDIANSNANASNLSRLVNDGLGSFGSAQFFEGGVQGEWALAAVDMNEDGILDLVVGGRNGEHIAVDLGNGDGTFTPQTPREAVGAVWMLVCGDLNGDGHADVATANAFSNSGSILFGDGTGSISPPVDVVPDPFPLATDLGDIDGDGDLDWMLSSFSGDWRLFTNDGRGNFTFATEFPAPQAASCALLVDIDLDQDLDLALVDELADVVIIHRQEGGVGRPAFVRGDVNGDGLLALNDGLDALLHLFAARRIPCPDAADIDDDGNLELGDPLQLLGFLFTLGEPPSAPWPGCGTDPTAGDPHGCAGPYAACP